MNICKETCPIFNGVCAPDECDIFKKQYSDLFDENERLKKEIDGHLKYISELRNRYEDARG